MHSRFFKSRSRTNLKTHPFEYFRCIIPDGKLVHHRLPRPPSPPYDWVIPAFRRNFLTIPQYPRGWRKALCESSVLPENTTHFVTRPLNLESNAYTPKWPRLTALKINEYMVVNTSCSQRLIFAIVSSRALMFCFMFSRTALTCKKYKLAFACSED